MWSHSDRYFKSELLIYEKFPKLSGMFTSLVSLQGLPLYRENSGIVQFYCLLPDDG